MSESATAIKELQNELETFVAKGHEKFDALESQGKTNSEGLAKLVEDFTATSEKMQEIAAKVQAEEQERIALEKLMARMPDGRGADAAKGDDEFRGAFAQYMRSGGKIADEKLEKGVQDFVDYHGLPTDDQTVSMIRAGLVGSNPDAGFLAPIDPVRFISQRLFETSPVRQVANVITTAREAVEVIIDDTQASAGWVGETQSRPETDTPEIADLEIPTHELYANPKLSQKSIDDVTLNLENWLRQKVAREFSRMENTAFMTGNGIKKPRGILDYGEWTTEGEYERWKLEHFDTETVGTLSGDDLIDIQRLLLEDYQANASWMMNRSVWGETMKLKDDDNQYLLNPQMLFAGVDMQLLGRPVRFASDIDSSIAEGNSIMIYGDFREGYTIVDRIGIRVLRDPYTAKPYIVYYTTKRVGGAVTNYQALKVLDVQAS